MSRIVVLGIGIVGRAAVWDLVRRGHEVTIGDTDIDALERVSGEYDVAGSTTVDASSPHQIADLIAGADVLVSAVPYRFGVELAACAVAAGCHYVDFGGNPTVVARQLELDEAARDAGVAVVPDCGLAPGFANVLAVGAVAALGPGHVDRVALRVGALPAAPVGALGYQLTFSPEGLLNEYAEPCEVLRRGRYTVVEPLTEIERVDWEGWGPLEAFHTAGGSSSLPRLWEGRVSEMDYKTLRYPGHATVFRALYELGMLSETPRRYGDATIAPRHVVLDALSAHLPRSDDDVVLVRTWASAERDGEIVTAGHQLVDRHDRRFSALARTTAFPATALAHALATGHGSQPGARTMQTAIDAADLIAELAPLGIRPEPWTG